MPQDRYQSTFSLSGLDKLQVSRHAVQLLVFLFLNAKIIGLVSTGIIVPYLHSTQAPFSSAIGAFDGLEYTLSKGLVPVLVLGIIYLTAATVGRLYCGWACPFGMVQDFLVYLPIQKTRFHPKTAESLRDIKWAFLGFSILTAILVGSKRSEEFPHPIGIFSDAPFAVLSPASTLFAYIPWMVLWKTAFFTGGAVAFLKFSLLVGALAPAVYIPRFFCRYICPLGAMLEPLSKYKKLKIYRVANFGKDELNKLLNDVCPMGVQVQNDENFIDHPGCVHCGKCVAESPRKLYQKVDSL